MGKLHQRSPRADRENQCPCCEYVQDDETEGHPDKLCDSIADAVLDACLTDDPHSRVACEVMAAAGKIIVAGDQGIVYGYACRETAQLLPMPVVLANRLTVRLTNARRTGTIHSLEPDGKAQVSVEYEGGIPKRIAAVVVSCQHDERKNLEELRREIMRSVIAPALRNLYPDDDTEVLINPSGRFVLGGFEADTGLTGRKLMVGTYGGLVARCPGKMPPKQTAAAHIWRDMLPKTLWPLAWQTAVQSVLPMPSAGPGRWQ